MFSLESTCNHHKTTFFFELYAFIILTSTLILGINYFVIITRERYKTKVFHTPTGTQKITISIHAL